MAFTGFRAPTDLFCSSGIFKSGQSQHFYDLDSLSSSSDLETVSRASIKIAIIIILMFHIFEAHWHGPAIY